MNSADVILPTGIEYFQCLSLLLSILINRFEMLMQPRGADAEKRPAEKTLHWMSLCISDFFPPSIFHANHAEKPQWNTFQVKEKINNSTAPFFFFLLVV